MGKPTGKKKNSSRAKSVDLDSKPNRSAEHSSKVFDEDTTVFIDMSHDMKEDGNKLFQKRDYEGAMLKYEKALKLLPKSHADAAYLHSNMAACYMQMNPADYRRAISECNDALEVAPKYSKALLKRAKCYEALDRLDLACKDAEFVLSMEPNNLTALEISERLKKDIEKKGIKLDDEVVVSPPEVVPVKEKKKKKSHKAHKVEDKVVVELKSCIAVKEAPMKSVKLVCGQDIRIAQIPENCSILKVREVVLNRYPTLKSVLIKYKDKEGDLVTITTSEELRVAEESAGQSSTRLHIIEVSPEHDPLYVEAKKLSEQQGVEKNQENVSDNVSVYNDNQKSTTVCIDHWIIHFARLFKNHVGFSSDEYLDMHEIGMKLYSEAMEETITNDEAQPIFELASEKFQEMAALALFNCGNVHMARARKKLRQKENDSTETIFDQVKAAYEWAKEEYIEAGKRYEEALQIKPNFYEGLLALGQEQFEQAKLCWYFAIASKLDVDAWPSSEVLVLLNNAEDNMDRGTMIWEEMEEARVKELSKPNKEKALLESMGIGALFKVLSSDEAAEQSSNMRSQSNLLWGTMLYERSVFEFKIGLPTWEECLMAAVEKFKLAGATPPDIAVMVKNHCANETTQEGLGFNIDEIVQAWNEMYDAKRWISGIASFRLEPLFRRRVPKLHHTLENIMFEAGGGNKD